MRDSSRGGVANRTPLGEAGQDVAMSRKNTWGLLTTTLVAGYAMPAHAADLWVDATAGGGGDGSMASPFRDLQDGVDAAQPGDTVHALPGMYGPIRTQTDGEEGTPITILSEEPRQAIVQADGTALEIDHNFYTFEGLVFDSTFGADDGVIGGGSNIEFIDVEIMNAGQDCVDLRTSSDILFDSSVIHHCVRQFDPDSNADAHGITGDSVFDLTVRDSEIYLVTGDAVQLSPSREPWDNVLVERTTMWSGRLDLSVNGWSEGDVIGENAFDTKVGDELNGDGTRPQATFRDVVAYGWRNSISNQAAFTIKEEVDFVLDGATIYDSEIGGRLRAPAQIRWQNVVMYDLDLGFRLEEGLTSPLIYNTTFGGQISTLLDDDGTDPVDTTMRNVLFLAEAVPALVAGDASNLAVDGSVFEDAVGHDYRLVMGSAPTDAGIDLAEVTADRLGIPRPFGAGFDIGAYEWTDEEPPRGESSGGETSSAEGSGDSGAQSTSGPTSGSTGSGSNSGGTPTGSVGSGTDTDTDSGGAGDGDDGGCGCTSAPRRWGWSLTAMIALACFRRRRP